MIDRCLGNGPHACGPRPVKPPAGGADVPPAPRAVRRAARALICLVALSCLSLAGAAAAGPQAKHPPARKLERADLLVIGACPLCCKRILWKLRHCPGVVAAEISIRSPHFAAVIYDQRKTSLSRVIAQITAEKAQAVTVEESAVRSVPARLELKAAAPPSGIHYADERAPNTASAP